jgi:colanic acid biosynthesis glycosyl transferase WcaI
LQPDAAFDLGMLRSGLLRRFLYSLELYAYRTATLVSAIGESMLDRIRSKGVPQEKLFYFPNWITLSEHDISESVRTDAAHPWDGQNGKFTVLYAGTMGEKQGLDVLIDAAAIAQKLEPDMQFLLVGDGAQRPSLESQAKRLGLKNVCFRDVLPRSEFLQTLRHADVSVLLQQPMVKDIVVPSKLLNILAVGSPVVAAVNNESETAKILSTLSVDVFTRGHTPRDVFEKIRELKTSPDLRTRLCEEERHLAEKLFDRDTVLTAAVRKLEQCAQPAQMTKE